MLSLMHIIQMLQGMQLGEVLSGKQQRYQHKDVLNLQAAPGSCGVVSVHNDRR